MFSYLLGFSVLWHGSELTGYGDVDGLLIKSFLSLNWTTNSHAKSGACVVNFVAPRPQVGVLEDQQV